MTVNTSDTPPIELQGKLSPARRMPRWPVELAGYFMASLAALLVDIGSLNALVEWVDWSPLAAAPAAFLLGLGTIYVMSTQFIFRTRKFSGGSTEFGIFLLIGVFGLCLNQTGIWLATEIFTTDYRPAKLGAAGATFALNFILRKLILFKG